ncbi:hypothetical protein [Nodosilinea sp. FACHB-13]|uniref:hypothetical protein n=1 Tax=Nodosilinea sp. FACHB-13 TaxID=2692831 RepID=UPI001F552154|nr:hypothetical protein [Nodosilinea sp. FACHB-13]
MDSEQRGLAFEGGPFFIGFWWMVCLSKLLHTPIEHCAESRDLMEIQSGLSLIAEPAINRALANTYGVSNRFVRET